MFPSPTPEQTMQQPHTEVDGGLGVIIGGLVSSTLLARIVTPVMYKLIAPHVGLVERHAAS